MIFIYFPSKAVNVMVVNKGFCVVILISNKRRAHPGAHKHQIISNAHQLQSTNWSRENFRLVGFIIQIRLLSVYAGDLSD